MPELPDLAGGGADEGGQLEAAIDLQIDERFAGRFDAGLTCAAVAAAIAHERGETAADGARLSLVVVDDEEIQRLNREFRGRDEPTDVLSFPAAAANEEFILPPDAAEAAGAYLGDVILSFPRAERQAAEYGHTLDREIAFLAVHGTLHLLGHDHETEAERARMRAAEEAVMAQFPALARADA